MRNINLRYVDETYDSNGVLQTYSVHYPENFNFAYDIVDDIAVNDAERRAMVWCGGRGARLHVRRHEAVVRQDGEFPR